MKLSSIIKGATVGLLLSSGSAFATVWEYEINNPPGNANAGDITNVSTSYNDITSDFSWEATFDPSPNANAYLPTGFWLVVSDGENPKNDANEYAILYGDTLTNTLTAYVYSGQNNANSWNNPGEFIASYTGMLDVTDAGGQRTIGFDMNALGINAFTPTTPAPDGNDWDGVAFGSQIGIWFHPFVHTLGQITYDEEGRITSFGTNATGWYDTAFRQTEIPTPLTLSLMLVGLVGLRRLKR